MREVWVGLVWVVLGISVLFFPSLPFSAPFVSLHCLFPPLAASRAGMQIMTSPVQHSGQGGRLRGLLALQLMIAEYCSPSGVIDRRFRALPLI